MVRICLSLALATTMLAATAGQKQKSVDNPLDAEAMKVALRTATPEEDGFIEYVLRRVDKGTLPLDMVESTFLWAKKKPNRKFQYFKRGLTLRAEQKGIHL
jgi:hypothetical protein